MNIARSHLDALGAFGYTEDEARLLYIVATYSGYFVARQFLAFQRVHWGKRTTVFWSKLERHKHARIDRYPKSGTIYHLCSRHLYRQIEKENLRNRRVHEIEFIKRRIAILDFVMAHQQYEYLETEVEKVAFFGEKLGITESFLPARLYLSRNSARSSVRYFVDQFPMFLASPSPVVTFTYLHDGANGFSDFVHHLGTYLPLFRQLSEFRMLYISRSDSYFARAREIFDSVVRIPLESDIAEELLRYFCVRKLWNEKRYAEVTDAELIFRNQARSRFKGEIFDALYRGWRMGLVSAAAIRERLDRNDREHSIAFGTAKRCPLPVPGEELMGVK
ncbi:MAG: hypothetical protein WA211_16730 [Candidatus Acidiferrales bacterium]